MWLARIAGRMGITDSETIKTSWALQDFCTFKKCKLAHFEVDFAVVQKYTSDLHDKSKCQAKLACLGERKVPSSVREIPPKASFDLPAGSWHGPPGVLETFSNTLLITPIMRAQYIHSHSHCGATRSNPTIKAAL